MHRFVHPQPLDVGPFERAAKNTRLLTRHALGVMERDELNEFSVVGGLHLIDQSTKRKSYPWYHHRPGFDAAYTVNPLFERAQFHDAIDVQGLWLFHFAFDSYGPRSRRQVLRVLLRISFVDAQLVKVVVRRDVLE